MQCCTACNPPGSICLRLPGNVWITSALLFVSKSSISRVVVVIIIIVVIIIVIIIVIITSGLLAMTSSLSSSRCSQTMVLVNSFVLFQRQTQERVFPLHSSDGEGCFLRFERCCRACKRTVAPRTYPTERTNGGAQANGVRPMGRYLQVHVGR